MKRWFTDYTGPDWNPTNGYSELFVEYVREISELFDLQKSKVVGVEVTKGVWKPFTGHGKTVLATIDKFQWTNCFSNNVHFTVDLRVAEKNNWLMRLTNRNTPRTVIFNEKLEIYFEEDFPISAPFFKVLNDNYRGLSNSYGHRFFSDGTMFIMNDDMLWHDSGRKFSAAFDAAINWIVWHNDAWGNDPGKWQKPK